MRQLFKQFFYKTRRWLAAALCIILCIQAVEPLGATIAKLTGEGNTGLTLLGTPGVDDTVFNSMDLYIEQRGEIFALDLEFEVAANKTTEEQTTEELTTMEATTTEESTVEESETESTTMEGTTAESTTVEETTAEGTTTEGITAESTTAESTTAESTTTDGSAAESTTVEESKIEGSSMAGATEGSAPKEESSAAQEPSSKDLEVEQIIHELESVYAEEPSKEIQILEQTKMEELSFEISFTDAFYLLESPGDKSVLNEEGKPIGTFELSQEEEKILLTVVFDVPMEREEIVKGSLQFSIGNTSGVEGDATLLWDAEAKAVDVEIEETWLGGLLDRFALKDMKDNTPKADSSVPPTSKSFEFDLMKQLPADITRKYDELKLVMNVPRASGTATTNTEISVRIDAKMKNSYLANELSSVEDEILNWLDESSDNAALGIMGWLESSNADKMPPIEFSIDFADSEDNPDTADQNEKLSFDVLSGATVFDILINGDKYGTCTLDRDSVGKKVTLTCELSKKLYGMKNVTFGANFGLNALKELKDKEVPDFQMNKGKIECSGTFLHFLDTEPSDKKPYTLVKTIEGDESKNSDTPYVTFKVEVDSYENLAGVSIVDELPAELQLSSLRLKCDNEAEKTLGKSEYAENNKVVSYKFPNDSTVKKAVLYVDAVLTPEKVFEMTNAANEAGQTATFTNKAYLKDSTDQKLDETEDTAEGKKRFQMFQKSGKQNPSNGSLLDWTIDIDVSFKGSLDVYLVDSLDPASHDYIDGGTLTVETGRMENGNFVKESTKNVSIQKKTTGEANIDYANVSADTLNTVTGKDLTKAYFYESASNEHVMALNLANYIGSNGKHVRVLYSTKITGLNNATGEDGKKKFYNYADLRWKALYWGGKGPVGDTANLQYNINKPVEAAVNMAVKRAGAYDEKTQLQTWYFDVNHYGMDYHDLVITEDFTGITDQKIPEDTGTEWLCSITQVHKGSGFRVEKIKKGGAGDSKPYYTKVGQKVEIHLGDVSAGDYFTVAFQTKVGGSALIGNTTDYELKNEAKISTAELGAGVTKATTDLKKIPNTLLEKEALKPDGTLSDGKINGYDSKTGELHWRISVNPNSLHIKDGVITDTLPIAKSKPGESNKFGRITKVTYGSGSDAKSTVKSDVNQYTGDTGKDLIQIGDSGIYIKMDKTTDLKKIKFLIVDSTGATAKDIKKPLTIEFTTKMDGILLTKLYEDSRVAQGAFVETYRNEACLEGKIIDSVDLSEAMIDPAKAKDDASHHVSIRGMNKGGTYKGKGVISWDAVINESHSNIGGLQLKDELSNQVEYKKGSLKLYKITEFKSDGTINTKEEITSPDLENPGKYGFMETKDAQNKNNTTGFNLKFPANDTEAYYISFETFIVEDAKPSDIINKLALHDGTNNKLVSNEANGGSDQEFFVDDYATGTPVPLLLLEKVSSSKDDYGKYQIKFKDVDFEISQIKRNSGNTGWEAIQPVKTKMTDEKGRKLFFDVEPGSIFRVREVLSTVPVGYTQMSDKFVYFKLPADKSEDPADLITRIRTSVDVPVGTDVKDIYLVDSLYKRLVLENTPDGASNAGKVKFIKQNEMGNPIEGVTYQLKHSKGWVAAQTVKSDANGVVTFERVDPSPGEEYYTLTEISSVEPYSLDKTDYKVEVNSGGTYTIKNGAAELPKVTVGGDTLYLLKNKLAAANLQITKQDSITKKVLQGAEYTLTGTDYLGRSVADSIGAGPFTTNDKGVVTMNNIPVNEAGEFYTLTESVYPGGYQQSSDKVIKYKVTVTGKELVLDTGKGYKDYKTEVKVERFALSDVPEVSAFTQVDTNGTAKVTLANVPVVGTIAFTKYGDIRGTKAPLGGVTFGLYTDAACTKPAKGSDGNNLKAESAKSGTIGKVTFDNVYYGEYYIKELQSSDRPKGYVISKNVVKVTVLPGDITETTVGTLKTYSFTKEVATAEEEKLTNAIAKANIQIKKTNQNGELLPGVEFSIERYGDADTAEPTGNSWVEYKVPNVSSGSNKAVADTLGMVNFGDVIYGTYRLKETAIPPEYALIVNQEPFYIKVGLVNNATTGAQTVKVVKYDTEPVNKSPENLDEGTVLTESSTGTITLPIINELKYGLIQLNKVAATKEVAGADTTYSIASKDGKANTIGDVYFEIYQASDINAGALPSLKPGATPYVTLKTNAKGRLDYITAVGDEYSYQDVLTGEKVKLLLGEYYIREKEAPAGYLVDTNLYPFSLTATDYGNIKNTDDSRYHWIKNTGTAAVKLNGTEDTTNAYFVNEIVRAAVTLDKVKKDKGSIDKNVKVKGATFIIYTDETTPKAVASLKWDDTSQKYLLSKENPLPSQVTFVTENAQGIPYVVRHDVTGAYELVAGKYFADEAVTPKGYLGVTDESVDGFEGRKKYRFEMDSAAPKVISNEQAPNNDVFTNTLGRSTLTVKKEIDITGAVEAAVTDEQKNPNGFQFTLTKKSTESGLDYTETTQTVSGGTAAAKGTVTFTDIPYGEYTLTEEKGTKDGYQLMKSVELKITQDGAAITSDLADRTDVAYNSTDKTVEVKNALVHGDITGTKVGDTGANYGQTKSKLSGAVFALYRDNTCLDEICEAAPTDVLGNFTIENIPYGQYWVKEKTAPVGYEISTEAAEVNINANGDQVVIDQNKFINVVKKSKLELVKTDATTDGPVSGAVFSIYGKEGTIKDQVVAYLVESAAIPGTYVLSNQGEEHTVNSPCLLYNTGEDSYYLAAGDYYYQETTTPKYYQENSNKVDITVTGTAAGDTETLTPITNTRELTNVGFSKVDEKNGSHDPSGIFVPYGIAGITFTLYSDAACTDLLQVQKVKSSGDAAEDIDTGTVLFTNLLPGTYYLKETAVPETNGKPMYLIKNDIYTFTVDEDVSDGVEMPELTLLSGNGETFSKVENVANPALEVKLTMDLKSTSGEVLPNAKFRLFRNGVYYATVWTGPDGRVDFGKVLPATYTLVQDTSVSDHRPIIAPIISKVEDPAITGITEYHIPVINDIEKSQESSGGSGGSSGGSKPKPGKETIEEQKQLPIPDLPNTPSRIVPDVIPSDMVLEKDIEDIQNFFQDLEDGYLTAEDLARKEQWGKEFQKNSKYWQEKFGMTKEEWESWMTANFGANYITLPKTGGMMGSIFAGLIGLGLAGYGAYETFGRRNKKCFKKKKK